MKRIASSGRSHSRSVPERSSVQVVSVHVLGLNGSSGSCRTRTSHVPLLRQTFQQTRPSPHHSQRRANPPGGYKTEGRWCTEHPREPLLRGDKTFCTSWPNSPNVFGLLARCTCPSGRARRGACTECGCIRPGNLLRGSSNAKRLDYLCQPFPVSIRQLL